MSKTFWTSTTCNEEVESQFEVCWNCQRDRTGAVPPNFSDVEIEDRAQKTFLNARTSDKYCLACQTILTYAGTTRIQQPPTGELSSDIVELLMGLATQQLETYYCPACGRVELFIQARSS